MTLTVTTPRATEKQIAFATRLLAEKDHPFNADTLIEEMATSSKVGISNLIENLLAMPRKASAAAPKIQEGFYVKDEVVYKVQANKAGTGVYGKRLDIEGGSGHWHYEPGLTRNLVGLEPLSLEVAAQMGVASGVCVICGRTLDNPTSIARGVGPVCAGRLA